MTLPAYAEELKRLAEQATTTAAQCKLGRYIINNLDRILRDAEIAKAAREYAIAEGAAATAATIERMLALIAKETP